MLTNALYRIKELKHRQEQFQKTITFFPDITLHPLPYIPSLQPYLNETDIADIVMYGTNFSDEVIERNLKNFSENLVNLENIQKRLTSGENMTTLATRQLNNFKQDIQTLHANAYKVSFYPAAKITIQEDQQKTIKRIIALLSREQVLKLTTVNNELKPVIYIYKVKGHYGYFDENFWAYPITLSSFSPISQYINSITSNTSIAIEQYTYAAPSSVLTRLRTPQENLKNLELSALTEAGPYLAELREQLNDAIPLDKLKLLEPDEIKALEGTPGQLQRVKEANDLLRECNKQERLDLLCFFLLENTISENKDAYRQLINLPDNLNATQLQKKEKALCTLEVQNELNIEELFFNKINETYNLLYLPSHIEMGETLSADTAVPILKRVHRRYNTRYMDNPKYNVDTLEQESQMSKVQKKMIVGTRTWTPNNIPKNSFEEKNIQSVLLPQLSSIRSIDRAGWALFLIALGMRVYRGSTLIKKNKDISLNTLEKIKIFLHGFINAKEPYPFRFKQFLNEKTVADELAKTGLYFLKANPTFDTYAIGLGNVSENIVKEALEIRPAFSSIDLSRERKKIPDIVYSQPTLTKERKITVRHPRYHKKSRKTPTLNDPNTQLLCAPAFDPTTEDKHTGLNDTACYACQNAFAIINKTRSAEFKSSETQPGAYFNLATIDKGQIFGSSKKLNVVDASQLIANKISYKNNFIESEDKEIKIETKNMNIFLGRPNQSDDVDCTNIPNLVYIITQGGKLDPDNHYLEDLITNCPNALLHPHTSILSTLEGLHHYDIVLNPGDIYLGLTSDTAKLSLSFDIPMNKLLTQIHLHKEDIYSELKISRLTITINKTNILTSYLINSIVLFDNQQRKLYISKDTPDSFLIEEKTSAITDEEKLRRCRVYRRQAKEKQLTCLIINKSKTTTGWVEDIFLVDKNSQPWIFIELNHGSYEIIPYLDLDESIHTLTDADLAKTSSWAIPVDQKHIFIYRNKNNFVLKSNSDHTKINFNLNLKISPNKLEELKLIYTKVGAFDCNKRENCILGKDIKKYRSLAITGTMEIKAIRDLFKYNSFNISHSHQQETILKEKINEEIKKLINPLNSADLKNLLANKLLTDPLLPNYINKKTILVKGLEFLSEKELDSFLVVYLFDKQAKEKALNLFQSEEKLKKTLQGLYFMAAKAFTTLPAGSVKILFSLLEPTNSIIKYLIHDPDKTPDRLDKLHELVSSAVKTGDFFPIEAYIETVTTPDYLQSIKARVLAEQSTLSSEDSLMQGNEQPPEPNVARPLKMKDTIKALDHIKDREEKRLQYFQTGNHISNAAHNAKTNEHQRSWLQSAGYWLYGIIGVIGASMAGYGGWLLSRRVGMKGSYVAVSTVEKVLEEVVVNAEEAPIEIALSVDSEAHSSEKGRPLLSLDNTQDSEEIEAGFNHETSYSISAFPVQENLLLADFLVRNITEEKYGNYIGDYSLERQQTAHLNDLGRKIIPALTLTEADWSSRFSAFEGQNYFAVERTDDNEGDILFSIRNVFSETNDWDMKTKRKKYSSSGKRQKFQANLY